MAIIDLVSNLPGAGKTCLAGALAAKSCQTGKRVAYYKPFSVTPEADAGTSFLAPLLAEMGSPQEGVPSPLALPISPEELPTNLSEAHSAQVESSLVKLETTFDLTIVDWDAPAPPAGSKVVMVFACPAGDPPAAVSDAIKERASRYGDSLAGVVVNNVPRHRERELMVEMAAELREQGLPILGAIPEDRQMLALTLQQVAEFLEGQWVEAPSDPDRWVDRFLIGGNILDSGPNYLGRFPHQAVITRAAQAGHPDGQPYVQYQAPGIDRGRRTNRVHSSGGAQARRRLTGGTRKYPGDGRIAGRPGGYGPPVQPPQAGPLYRTGREIPGWGAGRNPVVIVPGPGLHPGKQGQRARVVEGR